MLGVEIKRNAKLHLEPFIDYFKGFEKIGAVREIFGEETEKILKALKVEFFSRRGYMGVSNDDGHLLVSLPYLRNGAFRDIYLDVIHELVHVKQHIDGIELHDHRFRYSKRPTEIEAYSHAVKEARRLGMTDDEIYEYLRTEWMSEHDIGELAEMCNVKHSV